MYFSNIANAKLVRGTEATRISLQSLCPHSNPSNNKKVLNSTVKFSRQLIFPQLLAGGVAKDEIKEMRLHPQLQIAHFFHKWPAALSEIRQ